jgi:clan AA aspartic protease
MIEGLVEFPEARIRLEVRGRRGLKREINAVIDTGYTELLSLPPGLITALGLGWKAFGRAILADGSECIFDVYSAKVIWDGQVRVIRVDKADAEPLIGMSLMKGHELAMQIRTGGRVTIKRLS